jgi:excisionase family DNA binding protein
VQVWIAATTASTRGLREVRPLTNQGILALAAQVVADPLEARSLTPDEAWSVLGALAAAVAAVQAQASRSGSDRPVPPEKFADRLTLTTEETAEWLGLDEIHVADLCRRGEIVASKPGKAWMIRVEAIRDWVHRQEQHHPARAIGAMAPVASRRPRPRLDALVQNRRSPAS